MKISYEIENITDKLIDEVMPILEKHRVELQAHDMALNPDWEVYRLMEQMGKFIWIIARDEDAKIVGYSAYIISNNLHYKDYLYAVEDVFYVVNEKRGAMIGVGLVRKSEKIFKDMGVDVITHHAKFTNEFAPFLEKIGYKRVEVLLSKKIT